MGGKYLVLLVALFSVSCTRARKELGTKDNPVKFFFVPSVDVRVLEDNSKLIKKFLEKETPYKFEVSVPTSFISVVEAFGTGRADVAALNTYGYVLAHEKYGVQALLTTVRNGESTYRAQFIAKADGPIKKVEDIEGKRMAFVDPASTSGYILPMKYLKDRKIKPKETVFAMRHDNVVTMIYQGQVDAGATFYVSPTKEGIQDARMLVKSQYPNVEKEIKIIGMSDPIPNDPVVFRKDMPEEMKKKIADALIRFVETPEGKEALSRLSGVTGLIPATDRDYESTRATLKEIGKATAEADK